MEIYTKISFISILLNFFLVFNPDFVRCLYLTRISASNTAIDDVTNYVTHIILTTDLSYSCAHFVIETDEKYSLNGGF